MTQPQPAPQPTPEERVTRALQREHDRAEWDTTRAVWRERDAAHELALAELALAEAIAEQEALAAALVERGAPTLAEQAEQARQAQQAAHLAEPAHQEAPQDGPRPMPGDEPARLAALAELAAPAGRTPAQVVAEARRIRGRAALAARLADEEA